MLDEDGLARPSDVVLGEESNQYKTAHSSFSITVPQQRVRFQSGQIGVISPERRRWPATMGWVRKVPLARATLETGPRVT